MEAIAELELRQLLAGCQAQIKALHEQLEITAGSALATNVALHGLISVLPDLDLAGRSLATVRRDFEGASDPATAERAMSFEAAFDNLQKTIENRKAVLARQAQSPR
ncbi:TPA: hypothetical protein ACXN3R_004647 [Stenotrophomonas maltophilia]